MKRGLTILALNVLAMVALVGAVLMAPTPASAGGATQISGTGAFADGECGSPPPGYEDYDYYVIRFEGDLNGCLYGRLVEGSDSCSPSGAYKEQVDEIFVDANGTFETTSLFTAKFELNEDGTCNFSKEVFGRCSHPLTGVGTGIYEGVTGRFDIKDQITEGDEFNLVTFNYKGHLRFP